MMTQCPRCGSAEIIPEVVLRASAGGAGGAVGVVLVDPSGKGDPVGGGLRADICGNCGHVEIYSKKADLLLAAHKKGYVSSKP